MTLCATVATDTYSLHSNYSLSEMVVYFSLQRELCHLAFRYKVTVSSACDLMRLSDSENS